MRFSKSLLLALPALAVAEQQVPLADKVKGWLNKAQSYIPSAAPSVPNPLDAGASKVAEKVVRRLTLENWREVLSPSAKAAKKGPEEWMVYVTGNKTCYHMCDHANKQWNQSIPLLVASSNAPKLATIDCDDQQILCNTWATGPPSIWHFLLPAPLADQSKPATTVHYISVNRVNVTTADITAIHTKKKYQDTPVYEGYFHPFDGIVAKSGLAIPLAYAMWLMAKMPSWLPMILISFFTRSFMGRRGTAQQARPGQAAPAPAAAQ